MLDEVGTVQHPAPPAGAGDATKVWVGINPQPSRAEPQQPHGSPSSSER